ncbi:MULTISPECIES: hypothetical protein [unclassified Nostoc]|uniref:hypothetical protein n=1 Tax=unclassified Nostoc TaxID=2593658 RepID=UPI00260DEF4B|nr:hypothetical protein [Nostoc sp. S13]MDF5738490.1 hypothetical protein [Nostoc sp. S13]
MVVTAALLGFANVLSYLSTAISRSERIDELRRLLLNSYQGDIFFIERVVITEDRLYQKYQYIHGKDKLIFERNLS